MGIGYDALDTRSIKDSSFVSPWQLADLAWPGRLRLPPASRTPTALDLMHPATVPRGTLALLGILPPGFCLPNLFSSPAIHPPPPYLGRDQADKPRWLSNHYLSSCHPALPHLRLPTYIHSRLTSNPLRLLPTISGDSPHTASNLPTHSQWLSRLGKLPSHCPSARPATSILCRMGLTTAFLEQRHPQDHPGGHPAAHRRSPRARLRRRPAHQHLAHRSRYVTPLSPPRPWLRASL